MGTREREIGGGGAVVVTTIHMQGSTVTGIIIMGILHKYIPSRNVVDNEGFGGGGGLQIF